MSDAHIGLKDELHWEKKHVTPGRDKVPAMTKLSYGIGGVADFLFMAVPWHMIWPVYTLHFQLDTRLLGIVMSLPRIFGVIGDSVMGGISDNTRTRWGRRKPFILISVILGAILMPFMWTPIQGFGNWGMAIYLAVMTSVYTLVHSALLAPYQAMGYELSTDYDERTRIQAWKGYILGVAFFLNPSFFWICSRKEIFPNILVGAQWLSVIAGVVMIGCTLLLLRHCRESTEVLRQKKIPLKEALKTTITNRTFLILQGANLSMFMAISCGGAALGLYLTMHYVCGGSIEFYGKLTLVGGVVANLMTFVGVAMGTWISTHIGKRSTVVVGLGLIMTGTLALIPFMNPRWPWLSIIPGIIMNLGLQSGNLMFASMTADVCDEDELVTGLRREGAYSAVAGLLHRVTQIVLLMFSGFMPFLAGYTLMTTPPTTAQLLNMKWLLIGSQCFFCFLALILIAFYPLTRARSEETRRRLDARNSAVRNS